MRRCLGTQNPLQNHLQEGLEHKGMFIFCRVFLGFSDISRRIHLLIFWILATGRKKHSTSNRWWTSKNQRLEPPFIVIFPYGQKHVRLLSSFTHHLVYKIHYIYICKYIINIVQYCDLPSSSTVIFPHSPLETQN